MVLTPAVGYLVLGLLAYGDLKGDARVLRLAQDTTQTAVSSHATASGHSGTQADLGKLRTSQAVMEATANAIQEDVKENKALLKDISRSLNELKRQR